ncbi:MAG: hypothetical protein EA360_07965 [Balneolaceae bacterium]|nr:MAG: hypothetical protein EA360_07965 [Balneolaceae bacterium]
MEFTLYLVNLFSSVFLCGLIWTIQLVHYPIFQRLEKENFSEHLLFHGQRISIIVIPFMALELFTSGWLALFSEANPHLHIFGFLIVLMIWTVTFTVLVPVHGRLLKGYNPELIQKLIRFNWIRTFLWSLKAMITLSLLIG